MAGLMARLTAGADGISSRVCGRGPVGRANARPRGRGPWSDRSPARVRGHRGSHRITNARGASTGGTHADSCANASPTRYDPPLSHHGFPGLRRSMATEMCAHACWHPTTAPPPWFGPTSSA